MSSQLILIGRLAALERVVNNPLAITTAPDQAAHNESARLLRNGLAVMAFAILEDFARSRIAELFLTLEQRVTFGELPQRLQESATSGALDAVIHRKKFVAPAQRMAFVQEHASHIASTREAGYRLSPLAALNSEPNVQDEALSKLLKALGIDSPWEQISLLSARLGFGPTDALEAYKGLAQRRNEAAHQASSAVEHSDLSASIDAVTSLAAAMDILCGIAVRELCRRAPGTPQPKVKAANVALRRIDKVDVGGIQKWRESRETAARAVKLHSSPEDAKNLAGVRAKTSGEALILFDSPKRPVFWSVDT